MTLTDQIKPLEKIETSLNKYRDLKPGWSAGVGAGTSIKLIDCLIELFKKFYPADLSPPNVWAMVDGGFSFDWRLDAVVISLDIDDDPCLAELVIYDKIKSRQQFADKTIQKIDTSLHFTHIDVDITTPEGWETVNKTVSKFLKVEQLAS